MILLRSNSFAAAVAIALGAVVGGAAAFGPLFVVAGLLALAVGYAMLTSTDLGLVAVFAIITLLPFGTLPFRAIITPNFLTLALAALLGVWVLRLLAHGDAFDLRLSALGLPLLGFIGFTFFALFLGARGLPDPSTLHNYAKFVLGVLFFFTIINCVRTRDQARFALRALIIAGGASALLGLLLYALNDQTALRLLVSLGRIGYPTEGRVLRFVEDDPDGLERAIGTSVDPNSFGGMLALVSALAAAQIFAEKPLLRRWLLISIVGLMSVIILLTFSRAALFGLIIAAAFLATIRYRRLWWAMIASVVLAALVLFGLGIGGAFVERIYEGVRFEDQAQQMRLAEYQNAINIIARYPFFGIGFGLAPDIDLVAGVSSIYLAIAQRMGLLGLTAFLGIVAAWFVQTLRRLQQVDAERASWLLGAQAGLVAALSVGLADHYFFNIEFSHMVALFWGCAGLGVAIGDLQD
ncbi:MAG: O-antigen ligase family protein [Chloroflexales bacterium]|nr:O-antigen ligase family protein [Chloroflexales bacterium]